MTVYTWTCGCGTTGRGEDNARTHANSGCILFGWPGRRCTVPLAGDRRSPCGLALPCPEHGGER